MFQPMGIEGFMFLKYYLRWKKVPQYTRKETPVLAKSEKILWIPYLGISEEIKTKTYPTHILKITKTT